MSAGIVLAFAPFIVFAVLDAMTTSALALASGGIVALALTIRSFSIAKGVPPLLEAGSTVLFCGLAAYSLAVAPAWTVFEVRLIVDGGLLLIIVVSLAMGRPFTLQYARQNVPEAFWNSPRFIQANLVLSRAWALAFVVIVIADAAVAFVPGVPQRAGFLVIIAALYCAFKYTVNVQKRARAQS